MGYLGWYGTRLYLLTNKLANMSASNQIKWYENAAWDTPELNSPQPCIHGAGCVFTVKDADGKILPGCCRYVHPGEEGTGRRLFPERQLPDGRVQPACVRLTGAAQQFYERRGRKIPWQEWCKQQGIPFTPNKPGEKHEPVQKVAFGVHSGSSSSSSGSSKPDATIRAAMDLCQPYMRERHPMQDHASLGGSTAFGLNPRAFDVMAQQHAERSLDPRMMSRGFLGMPGGAEAARIASGGGAAQATENRSKIALKNARKRANKKAKAAAATAVRGSAEWEEEEEKEREYDEAMSHDYMCRRHSAARPLAWGPEPEGDCLCAGIRATQTHNRAAAAAAPPPPLNLSSPNPRRERPWMITTGRGGECSPDCCCPTGFQCHDRSDTPMMRCNAISCEELETGLLTAASQIPTPTISAAAGGATGASAPQHPQYEDEEDEESGGGTPRLSFDLEKAENIDYEAVD